MDSRDNWRVRAIQNEAEKYLSEKLRHWYWKCRDVVIRPQPTELEMRARNQRGDPREISNLWFQASGARARHDLYSKIDELDLETRQDLVQACHFAALAASEKYDSDEQIRALVAAFRLLDDERLANSVGPLVETLKRSFVALAIERVTGYRMRFDRDVPLVDCIRQALSHPSRADLREFFAEQISWLSGINESAKRELEDALREAEATPRQAEINAGTRKWLEALAPAVASDLRKHLEDKLKLRAPKAANAMADLTHEAERGFGEATKRAARLYAGFTSEECERRGQWLKFRRYNNDCLRIWEMDLPNALIGGRLNSLPAQVDGALRHRIMLAWRAVRPEKRIWFGVQRNEPHTTAGLLVAAARDLRPYYKGRVKKMLKEIRAVAPSLYEHLKRLALTEASRWTIERVQQVLSFFD